MNDRGGQSEDADTVDEPPAGTVDERSTDTASDADSASGASADEGALDSAAEAFLRVERRFVSAEGPWRAVGVDVVPATSVPPEYPREIDTEEALELTLRSADDRTEEPVYLAVPDDGVVAADSDPGRLLEALDVPVDRFGNLHGKVIPVTREAGSLVVAEPTPEPRGSDRAIYALLAGYAVLLAAAALALVGAGSLLTGPVVLLVLGLATFVVLPVATYLDGWHCRSTMGWGHAPGLWALLALLPGLNLVSTALYLLFRPREAP